MDPSEFVRMYSFLVDSRERFLGKFREMGWDVVVTDRGGTWGSMLGIFLHALDVEESWLYDAKKPSPEPSPELEEYVIREEDGSWEIDPPAFKSLEAVQAYHRGVVAKTSDLLERLFPEMLEEEFVLEWTEGKRKASMENILMHTFVDELAHLGELDCLMWQLDVDPDWLSWLDLHDRAAR
ncbi:MAG: DinB family protein, partial [Thermoplasmata archaeon]